MIKGVLPVYSPLIRYFFSISLSRQQERITSLVSGQLFVSHVILEFIIFLLFLVPEGIAVPPILAVKSLVFL